MHDQPGWQATTLRLLDVFIDGLRIQPKAKKASTDPKPPTNKRTKKRTNRR
jgi:hypothetical protein